MFAGETLDLTKTKLCAISGTGAFNGVPIVGLLLPDTVTSLDDWNLQGTAITSFAFPIGVASIAGSQFNDCKSLATIYINNTTTKISDRAFNNTVLEKIFFVGTEAELNTLLDNTGTANNAPFWTVVGENRENLISYADYLALEDKSGSYAVYGYSYCEAYNEGKHNTEVAEGSGCLGICTICQMTSMLENPVHTPKDVLSFNGSAVVDYYANMSVLGVCEHCETQVSSEDYGAMFIKMGFSVAEDDTTSISFFVAVNHKALAKYEEVAGTTVEYGLLVSATPTTSPIIGVTNDEMQLADNTLKIEMTGEAYTKFSVKITGLPENQELNCCGYVVEGEKVTYLNHATADAEAATVSHAIALELQNSSSESVE